VCSEYVLSVAAVGSRVQKLVAAKLHLTYCVPEKGNFVEKNIKLTFTIKGLSTTTIVILGGAQQIYILY